MLNKKFVDLFKINFALVSGAKLSAFNSLGIIKLSISCLIEIIIAHEDFLYDDLGLGMRKNTSIKGSINFLRSNE